MDESTASRLQAMEDLLGHIVLMLETEPRFTAARMTRWLRMVEEAQRASQADTRRTVAARELWRNVMLAPRGEATT